MVEDMEEDTEEDMVAVVVARKRAVPSQVKLLLLAHSGVILISLVMTERPSIPNPLVMLVC
jgi:hypothetical protein